MHRRVIWGGSVVSGLLLAITALAQSQPDIGLTLEPSLFTRARTSVLRVSVDIPNGYYIPAETADAFKGAWLVVLDHGRTRVRERRSFRVEILARRASRHWRSIRLGC